MHTTYIDVGQIDRSRPANRPSKNNWKIELLKKGILALQYVSPRVASELIWSHFTRPGKPHFTEPQQELLAKAETTKLSYFGYEIVGYKWGTGDKKVLLSHGWRSKIADFRNMINHLVRQGYTVEGIDMKAHGQSGGRHTALPEFRDILKNHYVQNGPYDAVIGYSLGGLASGIMLSELSADFRPNKLFLIATPPFTRYFFAEAIRQVGCKEKVYDEMCQLVEVNYHQSIDYFDLRTKVEELKTMDLHLIYDEQDDMVPFDKGVDFTSSIPGDINFVHTKGLGHYKIISHQEIVNYVMDHLVSETCQEY